MTLTDLPAELVLSIAGHLTEGDIARLLPINKYIHAQLSEYLLRRNASRQSLRALLWATSKPERLSVARRLTDYGADINHRFSLATRQKHLENATLLHFATSSRRPFMTSALLALGADPSKIDAEGRKAIYYAYGNNDEEAIRSISKKTVKSHESLVDHDKALTSLHMTCTAGLIVLIREYIEMGMDISAKDCVSATPLDYAESFLGYHSIKADKDIMALWTRLLEMLGKDTASAGYLVTRRVSFGSDRISGRFNIERAANSHFPAFRPPFLAWHGFHPNSNDVTASEISEVDDSLPRRERWINPFAGPLSI